MYENTKPDYFNVGVNVKSSFKQIYISLSYQIFALRLKPCHHAIKCQHLNQFPALAHSIKYSRLMTCLKRLIFFKMVIEFVKALQSINKKGDSFKSKAAFCIISQNSLTKFYSSNTVRSPHRVAGFNVKGCVEFRHVGYWGITTNGSLGSVGWLIPAGAVPRRGHLPSKQWPMK